MQYVCLVYLVEKDMNAMTKKESDTCIDESLAYAARGEVVRSQRAQDTWQALWSRGQSLAPATLAREARDRSLADRSRWLQEWDLWVMERGR